MKEYTGINKEGFDRDRAILIECRESLLDSEFISGMLELANDYSIPEEEIFSYFTQE